MVLKAKKLSEDTEKNEYKTKTKRNHQRKSQIFEHVSYPGHDYEKMVALKAMVQSWQTIIARLKGHKFQKTSCFAKQRKTL